MKKDYIKRDLAPDIKGSDHLIKYDSQNGNPYIKIVPVRQPPIKGDLDDMRRTTQIVKSGLVLDDYGQPLIGANLKDLTNPYNGTSTGFDGEYDLTSNSNADIMISHVGYKSRTIKANVLPEEIILIEDVNTIDTVDLGTFSSKKGSMIIPFLLLLLAFLGLKK